MHGLKTLLALHVGVENSLALVVKGHDPKLPAGARCLVDEIAQHSILIKLKSIFQTSRAINFVMVIARLKAQSIVVIDRYWSPSFRYCRMLASNKQSDIYYQIRMWSDLGHAQLVPLLSKVDYVVHCDQDYSI